MNSKTVFASLRGRPCKDAFNHILFDIFVLDIDGEIGQQKVPCQKFI